VKQRIELIQGFEMPMLSSSISMTRDGQYIFVTGNFETYKIVYKRLVFCLLGSYKPRVRCYDLNELSLKFERCFDHECIQMKILSEDYSKVKTIIYIRSSYLSQWNSSVTFEEIFIIERL
jgi:ribosome biogenesis protein ENP2